MPNRSSCVTIHMVASFDGFIARRDGSVDWLETTDKFEEGDTMDPEFVEDHTVGFRGSEQYQRWRALLHHFYDPFPTVEHFEPVRACQT